MKRDCIIIRFTRIGSMITGYSISIGENNDPVYRTGKPESIINYCYHHFGFTPAHQIQMRNGKTETTIPEQRFMIEVGDIM